MSSEIQLQRSLPLGNYRQASDVIDEDSMATVQLFDGETTYTTNARKEGLRSLRVRHANRRLTFCPRAETERLGEIRGLKKKILKLISSPCVNIYSVNCNWKCTAS